MQLWRARSSGVRGGRCRAKYAGAPTTTTLIGPITRTAIMSAAAQSLGPIPASNPFATMSPGAASAWTSSWTSRKVDKKARPDGGDDRCAGKMGRIEAQAPEGMALLAFEVVRRPRDLLDRRPSPVGHGR